MRKISGKINSKFNRDLLWEYHVRMLHIVLFILLFEKHFMNMHAFVL